MVDGKTFFEQAFKNYIKIYDKIQKLRLVKEKITQLFLY